MLKALACLIILYFVALTDFDITQSVFLNALTYSLPLNVANYQSTRCLRSQKSEDLLYKAAEA